MFETFFEISIELETLNDTVFIVGDINASRGEMCGYSFLDDEILALTVRKNDKKGK